MTISTKTPSLRLASTLENLEHQICGQKCGPKIMTRMVGMSSWLCDHFEMKVWCSDCHVDDGGPWRSCSYHNVGVGLLVYLSYKWLQWKQRYHTMAFTDPKKNTKQRHWKQHPRITMPSTKDLTVLLKKRKNKSIWTTTSKKTQTHGRRPGFQVCPWSDAIVSLPWSTRSRPPRLFVEVNTSEKTMKNQQNDNRKSPSFNIFSTVVVGTSSFMLHAYLFISVILVFAGVMAQSFFWSSEQSRTK